jgi:tryptophanyl-tRNA synthetase
MKKKIVLTGIQPSGDIHVGNYFGAIDPILELQKNDNYEIFIFIADVHSLNSVQDAKTLKENIYKSLATYLACGIDPDKITLYKQSDISEIFELQSYLNNFLPKSLLNTSHAYQTKLEEVKEDSLVNMGLFNYPILMASDILLFNADLVPIGKDQKQHIELARLIARKLNNQMGTKLTEPQELIKSEKLIIGTDGRKMSKSYNNTIPLFSLSKKMKKNIMSIKTDSLDRFAPKPIDNSIMELFRLFLNTKEQEQLEKEFQEGLSYGEAKERLFFKVEDFVKDKREKYEDFLRDKKSLDKILLKGKIKAKKYSEKNLLEIKKKLGLI